MPKKWHSNQYNKPPSTPPASFSNRSTQASSSNTPKPTVNELLTGLRNASISPDQRKNAPVPAPSLPPPIRQLLNIPDSPTPRPRLGNARRSLANGRRLPPGPAPPSSWLGLSTHAVSDTRSAPVLRDRPRDIDYFPGVKRPKTPSLVDACLRQLARDWPFHIEYDQYYISSLPARLRELLLSYVAVYNEDTGVTYIGLNTILFSYDDADSKANTGTNEDLHRLDLAGSIGRTISFKQLLEIVTPAASSPEIESWDTEAIPQSLQPRVPLLTHLSLAYPSAGVTWARLLKFSSSVPTITHLSLAHWPTPNMTPNARTTKVTSDHSPDVHYGGTNIYSHALDDDWTEATSILRRLSAYLYRIQYLDLDGCTAWAPALRFEMPAIPGIDWRSSWKNVNHILLRGSYDLSGTSSIGEVTKYKEAILESMRLERHVRRQRGSGWVHVEKDEWNTFDFLLPSTAGWNARFQQIIRPGATDSANSPDLFEHRRTQAAAAFWAE